MKYLLIFAVLVLAGCSKHEGHDETHMHAAEAVEIAQANAKALAPTAQEIKFDDEGMPKMGSAEAQAATAEGDTAKSDTPATEASDATTTTQTADASKAAEAGTPPVQSAVDDGKKADDKKDDKK